MMAIDLYIAFLIATVILVLMPGPIVTLIIANSLANGTRSGVSTAIGTIAGTAVLLTIGVLGMAWILQLLSTWLNWIRWAGAAYLVFLGLKQWGASEQNINDIKTNQGKLKTAVLHGFIVAVTNPKTILFFAALFPQFIDPTKQTNQQLLIMSSTFISIALVIDCSYALLAGHLRDLLTGKKRGHLRNKITGLLLILTGIGLAVIQKV